MHEGLTTDQRTAVGHAAVALGRHLRYTVRVWGRHGMRLDAAERAYLGDQLANYRTACDLSGQTPSAAICRLVEGCIAKGNRVPGDAA